MDKISQWLRYWYHRLRTGHTIPQHQETLVKGEITEEGLHFEFPPNFIIPAGGSVEVIGVIETEEDADAGPKS